MTVGNYGKKLGLVDWIVIENHKMNWMSRWNKLSVHRVHGKFMGIGSAQALFSEEFSFWRLRNQQSKAMTLFPSLTVRSLPVCLRRCPIKVRQPVSTTPEPIAIWNKVVAFRQAGAAPLPRSGFAFCLSSGKAETIRSLPREIPDRGGGPRCLDSLNGMISSEPSVKEIKERHQAASAKG